MPNIVLVVLTEQRRTMYRRLLVWKDVRDTRRWERSKAGVAVRMVVPANLSDPYRITSFTSKCRLSMAHYSIVGKTIYMNYTIRNLSVLQQ